MIIFLRRIPPDTNKYEIREFIEPALSGRLFAKKGHITAIKILHIRDNVRNTNEYHGLVRIEPETAAERVIQQLDKKPINGKNIVVREYHHRNWHNDPRLRRNHFDIRFADRRVSDRRRKTLEIAELLQDKIV